MALWALDCYLPEDPYRKDSQNPEVACPFQEISCPARPSRGSLRAFSGESCHDCVHPLSGCTCLLCVFVSLPCLSFGGAAHTVLNASLYVLLTDTSPASASVSRSSSHSLSHIHFPLSLSLSLHCLSFSSPLPSSPLLPSPSLPSPPLPPFLSLSHTHVLSLSVSHTLMHFLPFLPPPSPLSLVGWEPQLSLPADLHGNHHRGRRAFRGSQTTPGPGPLTLGKP